MSSSPSQVPTDRVARRANGSAVLAARIQMRSTQEKGEVKKTACESTSKNPEQNKPVALNLRDVLTSQAAQLSVVPAEKTPPAEADSPTDTASRASASTSVAVASHGNTSPFGDSLLSPGTLATRLSEIDKASWQKRKDARKVFICVSHSAPWHPVS